METQTNEDTTQPGHNQANNGTRGDDDYSSSDDDWDGLDVSCPLSNVEGPFIAYDSMPLGGRGGSIGRGEAHYFSAQLALYTNRYLSEEGHIFYKNDGKQLLCFAREEYKDKNKENRVQS